MIVTTRASPGRSAPHSAAGVVEAPRTSGTTLQAMRRLVAEAVGTFFLVTAAAGADIVADLHPGP